MLTEAMTISWTQNVVILKTDLCYTEEKHTDLERNYNDETAFYLPRQYMLESNDRVRDERL